MLGFRRKEVIVAAPDVVEDEPETTDEATTTTGNHCAWCGDPPDEHGSHGICAFHAEQLIAQAAARRRRQ